MYTLSNPEYAKAYWHWYFLIQPSHLPETLINGAPRQFVEMLISIGNPSNLSIFHKDAVAEYTTCMEDKDCVHATCQDYRAAATHDLDEAKEDLDKGKLIQSPIRVLVGKNGVVSRFFDVKKEWSSVTADGVPVEVEAVDAGHFIPEQIPDVVISNILEFLQ
jgi:hypothetical protein